MRAWQKAGMVGTSLAFLAAGCGGPAGSTSASGKTITLNVL